MVKFSFKNSIIKTLVFVSTSFALTNYVDALTYSYSANAINESDKNLVNPYIGWWHGATTIDLNDYPYYNCNYVNTFSEVKKQEPGLQYLGVRLAEFRDREISDYALTALQKRDDPSLQMILRFYYDGSNNYKVKSGTFDPLITKSNENKNKRSESTSESVSDVNSNPTFKQLDNGELHLTYEDYAYFKKEYNPNILEESSKPNVGDEKSEDIPKIEYRDSNGNFKVIELTNENDTLDDLDITKKDRQKLEHNEKYNDERYYDENNKLSLTEKEFEDYKKNAIFINDKVVNDSVNSTYEKRDVPEEFYKNADESMFIGTKPVAKELYLVDLDKDDDSVYKLCIRNFNQYDGDVYDKLQHKNVNTTDERINAPKGYEYNIYDTKEIEPPNLDIILTHIIQLSDIVNDYKDLIYIYQGAFVGTYGEMHNSNHLKIDELSTIIHALNELIDPSIFLSVRTPAYYRELEKTFKDNNSKYYNFNYSLFEKRMSIYNDGLFYSVDDCGTFNQYETKDTDGYTKLNRENEEKYLNNLCLKVPNGGEGLYYGKSIKDYKKENEVYRTFSKADEHARKIRLSYLDDKYQKELLDYWEGIGSSEVKKVYSNWNVNAKQAISRHLGYRYVITGSKLVKNGNTDQLRITIKNVGYSPSYQNFDVKLHFVERNGNDKILTNNNNSKTTEWVDEATVIYNFTNFKGKANNVYDVYLRVVDQKTNYPIKFGINIAEDSKYGYKVGTVTVK
ncbi:hypothetical protein PIROE2DRAFT_1109 [Piromyces sp. E2]|nr:hypothetical protein PIROE2DRAFT_1109 [Piromyces sp. E2]|eukprot:OUM70589.1 hypothetical protein PIROE2DRAFT_1109 [Piromyces sp. E2]